jgi:orotate phosphoribosyltransferase
MSVEIAEALLDIGGLGFRPYDPVTFKSGIQSPVYCDNRQFPFWPAQWSLVIRGFQRTIADNAIKLDVIGGVEAAGIPHSAALGFASQRPSVFIRKQPKEHGTRKRVEGGNVQGRTVLLVEDLVTTGSSSLAGVQALRDEGATVTDCLAIISYGFPEAMSSFHEAGVRLHTLTSFPEVLEVARKRAMMDEAAAAVVEDWLRDPHGWAQRRQSIQTR